MDDVKGGAIVTGGGGTLGRVVAARLSRSGLGVVVMGRRPEPLEAVVQAAPGPGPVVACPGDVREPDDVTRAVSTAMDRFGRLDLVVHAAALLADPHGHDVDPWTHFSCVMRTNVLGAALLVERSAPAMGPGGLAVLIGSSSAHRPTPDALAYGASKAALEQLTASLAARHGPRGLRVVCVAPGWLGGEGPGTSASEDVAEAIVFLRSRWGRRVQGTVWALDRGESVLGGAGPGGRR